MNRGGKERNQEGRGIKLGAWNTGGKMERKRKPGDGGRQVSRREPAEKDQGDTLSIVLMCQSLS